MQTTSNNQNKGPFHKAGISFGQAGGIVRYAADSKIFGVYAAWSRFRHNNIDKVFSVMPEGLSGPIADAVQVVELKGEAGKRRHEIVVRPEAISFEQFVSYTPGGSWGVIHMNRIPQTGALQTMEYGLDERWRLSEDGITVPSLKSRLNEDAASFAAGQATGWPILYASAVLWGGQSEATMPERPVGIPQILDEAIQAEWKFRETRRRYLNLTPEAMESLVAKLTPAAAEALDNLLQGRRGAGSLVG